MDLQPAPLDLQPPPLDLQPPPCKDILASLPEELRFEILKNLEISQLLSSRHVSQKWNEILSSYKDLWTELCSLNGIVYTERDISENPEKYRLFFLRMKPRADDLKLGRCFIIQFVPHRSDASYFRFNMQAFHSHEFKICVATMGGLIYIFDQNRSPIRIIQIRLKDFVSIPCRILYVRLDNNNVAVLEERGFIWIWDVNDGHFVASYRVIEDVFCFDLLKGTCTVACGLRGYVKIVDVVRSEDIVVEISEHQACLQVVVTRHWSENPESQPQRLLVFSMNNVILSVHEIRNFFFANEGEFKSATLLHNINLGYDPLFQQFICPHVPSFCYDGSKYLYFPHIFNPDDNNTVMSQFDVSTGECKNIYLGLPVHEFLGAGKMNLVFTSADVESQHATLHAIDTRTNESRFTCPLISDARVELRCYDDGGRFIKMGGRIACVGQKSWLDGLNGFNDVGHICVYRNHLKSLKMIRWRDGSGNR